MMFCHSLHRHYGWSWKLWGHDSLCITERCPEGSVGRNINVVRDTLFCAARLSSERGILVHWPYKTCSDTHLQVSDSYGPLSPQCIHFVEVNEALLMYCPPRLGWYWNKSYRWAVFATLSVPKPFIITLQVERKSKAEGESKGHTSSVYTVSGLM